MHIFEASVSLPSFESHPILRIKDGNLAPCMSLSGSLLPSFNTNYNIPDENNKEIAHFF